VQNSGRYHELRWSVNISDRKKETTTACVVVLRVLRVLKVFLGQKTFSNNGLNRVRTKLMGSEDEGYGEFWKNSEGTMA
jgi:hypothetical protein